MGEDTAGLPHQRGSRDYGYYKCRVAFDFDWNVLLVNKIVSTWGGENPFIAGEPWQLESTGSDFHAIHWYCGVYFKRAIRNASKEEFDAIKPLYKERKKTAAKKTTVITSLLAWPFTEPMAGSKIVVKGRNYFLRCFSVSGRESYLLRSSTPENVQEAYKRITGRELDMSLTEIMGGSIFLKYAPQQGPVDFAKDSLLEARQSVTDICIRLIEEGGPYGLLMAERLLNAVGAISDVIDMSDIPPP